MLRSATRAAISRLTPRVPTSWTWPRRWLRSPITAPRNSSSTVTSTAMIGSRPDGLAARPRAAFVRREPRRAGALPRPAERFARGGAAADLAIGALAQRQGEQRDLD